MKYPRNLIDALSGDMAKYMTDAINAAKANGVLSDDTPLDGNSLGEIREQLYVLGRSIRASTGGKNDKPIGDDITFVERIAFHPENEFWK